MEYKGSVTLIAILLAFALFSWKNGKLQDEKLVGNASSFPAAISQNTTLSTTTRFNTNDSQHANIDATLRIVAQKWKKTDVNMDGLHNCIDASLLFYKYYPEKSKVCIEINVNSKTGMNHLFNCVFTEGVWKAIEPQAYAMNYKNYYMWYVWGNKYDNKHNRDVTEIWKTYVW